MPHTSRWDGSGVIKRVGEFDPRLGSEKCGQAAALRPFGARQENGNHAKTPAAIVDALIDGRTHLLVLPGAKSAWTHKDGTSFRFRQGLFNCGLPWIARNQVPLVKPNLVPSLAS